MCPSHIAVCPLLMMLFVYSELGALFRYGIGQLARASGGPSQVGLLDKDEGNRSLSFIRDFLSHFYLPSSGTSRGCITLSLTLILKYITTGKNLCELNQVVSIM